MQKGRKWLLFSYRALLCLSWVVAGIDDLPDADVDLLRNLYDSFQHKFKSFRPHKGASQFAVIAFNGAGNVFMEDERHQDAQTNYKAATVMDVPDAAESRLHAEERVISSIDCWVEGNHVPETIHLFTYYAPCAHCVGLIQTLARKYPGTNIYVGYLEYTKKDQKKSPRDHLLYNMEIQGILSGFENVYIGRIGFNTTDVNNHKDMMNCDSAAAPTPSSIYPEIAVHNYTNCRVAGVSL